MSKDQQLILMRTCTFSRSGSSSTTERELRAISRSPSPSCRRLFSRELSLHRSTWSSVSLIFSPCLPLSFLNSCRRLSFLSRVSFVLTRVGDINDTFGDFTSAIATAPSDPDIYYHRGQVYFIAGELEKAIEDYTKSCELDDTFIFSHVQKAVTEYRLEKSSVAMASFRKILKKFPERSEPYNY